MRLKNTDIKNLFLIIFRIIGILAIPVVLIGISFNIIAYDNSLYLELFSKYGVYSSLENYDPEYMNLKVLDFLNNGDDTSIKEFFNEREVIHMHDVRLMILTLNLIVFWAALLLFISVLYFIICNYQNLKKAVIEASKILFYGSAVTLLVSAMISLIFFIGFGEVFDIFHKTFFIDESYLFNPSNELIVVLYPENIFYELAIRIFGLILILSIILVILSAGQIFRSKIGEIIQKIRRH